MAQKKSRSPIFTIIRRLIKPKLFILMLVVVNQLG